MTCFSDTDLGTKIDFTYSLHVVTSKVLPLVSHTQELNIYRTVNLVIDTQFGRALTSLKEVLNAAH